MREKYKEYKFIAKIREEGKLINWFKTLAFLTNSIMCNNYDFIKNRIWIETDDYNQMSLKGIEIGEIRF